MKRRSFLLTMFGCCPFFLFSKNNLFSQTATSERAIPPADLKKIGLDAFTDDELDLPYYVAHFDRLANSVVMEGKDKGFISLSVWRSEKDNKPYNARIMENILSLAFFYVTKRPWNPFFGDERLRSRLEAALDFWCRSNKDGRFSEYSSGGYNLAASAFSTKFMGETISLLQAGEPKIDPALFKRVCQIDRKTLMTVLGQEDMIRHGRVYSNQYTNIFAGGLAYLDVFPDPELRTLLEKQVEALNPSLQSPVGFFYEKDGPDWSYNLGTHHSNLRMCWFYSKNTNLAKFFLEEEQRFIDWISYNAVQEPSDNVFYLNRPVETRTSKNIWYGFSVSNDLNSSLFIKDASPLASAFLPSREEMLQRNKKLRESLKKNWPETGSMKVGDFGAFSPYRFLHRRHIPELPSRQEKELARKELPYFKNDQFTQQRLDSRKATCFTFVRRPSYYLAFNSGKKANKQQRFGLGFFWTPEYGTFLQSQRETGLVWGTWPEKQKDVIEAEEFFPKFFQNDVETKPESGISNLKAGPFRISYDKTNAFKKEISFDNSSVRVSVTCPGNFIEFLPLLVTSGKDIRIEKNLLTLSGKDCSIEIRFNGSIAINPGEKNKSAAGKQLVDVQVKAKDSLEYVFKF